MRPILLFAIVASVILLSCSPVSYTIKYPTQPDDVYANSNLKNYFSSNSKPSVVLRISNSEDKITTNTNKQSAVVLYNAIEKELLKQGYSVRDRGLFNEIVNKSGATDYSKIKELTNTDLILEVINIDPKVIYSTNKVTATGKRQTIETLGTIDYESYGASAEFRLIMVSSNEIAGSYQYNYKPCPTGCDLGSFLKVSGKQNNKNKKLELRETISVNTLEEFLTICTKDLVKSFKS